MENRKDFIINVLYYALIIILVYLFYKYILPILMPFVIGFLIAFVSLKICHKLFKNDSKIMRIICTVLLIVLVVGILIILIALGFNKVFDLVANFPNEYRTVVKPVLDNLETSLINLNNNLPINIKTDMNSIVSDISDSIQAFVNSLSSSFVSIGSSIISNTSSMLVSTIMTLVSAFFFVLDYEHIFDYLISLMDSKTKDVYFEIVDFVQNTVFLIIKSYGLIMFITFVELLIGFFIFGIDNAIPLALFIAFLDILPVLGVGTVLIPWGLFLLITGNIKMGICILGLHLVITLIRNIIEPKIVGGNLGLHPLVTLSSMLVGLNTFGVLGMFGFPLMISFFVKRNQNIKTIENGVK